jgi:hypothetical protein
MNQTKKFLCAIGFGVASWLAAGSAVADDQKAPTKSPDQSADKSDTTKSTDMSKGMANLQKKSMEAKVVRVDQAKRHLVLQGENGQEMTVNVPSSVKRFNEIKAGDTLNIDFYESMALSLNPVQGGGESSMKSQTLTERQAGKLPGGMIAHQESGTVEIVKVDKDKNQVTVKRPNGDMDVIDVADPDLQSHLSSLKEGDKVHASYTEAAVIDIQRPNKTQGMNEKSPKDNTQGMNEKTPKDNTPATDEKGM